MLHPKTILRNRYRILGFLGRGGMADVYLALDIRRQTRVAIKVLREDLAEDPAFLRRFAREAQALARLDHPNIVRFYSFEREGAIAFIVMDYIEGVTLRRLLLERGGPLELAEMTSILQQVGAALHYAHAEGFIHRDLKPGNIMIHRDGRVFLSDFGIAKAMDSATVTTVAAGTPAYMSPEQILGRKLDFRTDIYSLGVVVFQMATGQRPFTGEEPGLRGEELTQRIRDAHLHLGPPDPHTINPDLPPQAAQVILRALAKQPQARWPNVMSMVRAWENAVGIVGEAPVPIALPASVLPGAEPKTFATPAQPHSAGPAPHHTPLPESPPRRRLAVLSITAVVLAAILAGAFFLFSMDTTTSQHFQTPSSTQRPPDSTPTTVAPTHISLAAVAASPTSIPTLLPSPSPTPTWTPAPTPTSTPTPAAVRDIYIEYLIDASNGMMQPWRDGSEPKFASVQRVLPVHWQFVAPEAHLGLRVYGHRYPATDSQSCSDVELLLPIQQWTAQQMTDALLQIAARGMDCQARALSEAYGDFQFVKGRRNAVILISEAGDTCGGNPLQVVQSYLETGITLPIHVVALEPDAQHQTEFQSISRKSGGRYFEVHNAQQLYDTLGEIVKGTSLPH